MERYLIYKLGIAILFYAVYCRRPMVVNGLEIDDLVGTVNNKTSILDEFPSEEYFVFYQGVQGKPGLDFPVHYRIPRTSFSCKEVESGYYADLETDCQVFHICNEGTKVSFLCPNGTIFQQSDLICDWWFKVNCTNSPSLYEESAEQLRESHLRRKAGRRVSTNRGEVAFNNVNPIPADRKMDVGSTRGAKTLFAYDLSEEMQVPQETASFVGSKGNYNNVQSTSKANPYPNHRETYSDVKQVQSTTLSQNLPRKNAFNNGRPFVVSTPKLGSYTTQRSAFVYSPTVPTTPKGSTPSTTKKVTVESFTNPPSVENGISTTARKSKNKLVFGLNSLQGAVQIKTQSEGPVTTKKDRYRINLSSGGASKTPTTQSEAPATSKKDVYRINSNSGKASKTLASEMTPSEVPATTKKDVYRINFSSGFASKKPTTEKTQSVAPATTKKDVYRINLSSGSAPKAVKTGRNFQDDGPAVPPLPTSLENEIPERSATNRPSIFNTGSFRPAEFITSSFNSGSITGSKNTYIPTSRNTYIPTTQATTTSTEYHSNTFGFVKPTGLPRPKPFELPLNYQPTTSRPLTDSPELQEFINPTNQPNYQISSASPFTNVPPTLPSSYTTYKRPTVPTLFTSAEGFTTAGPISGHVHDMLDTLKEIANVRFAKEEEFETSRPGLIVPPSVGPQTLHTLAVYFANALDNLMEEGGMNITEMRDEFGKIDENMVINSLLSRKTLNKYHELFNEETTEEADTEENDLDREQTNNAVQSPRVRQLAQVFTQALSSYLDDPEMFRKVLQQVRPTEPPTEAPEEDELLNFSDADIKPELPRLPTPAPANPTWGYILAFNKSTDHFDNHVGDAAENLQSADSQSFVPGYNEIATRDGKKFETTERDLQNHWTSSPDATKLWQTTLYVNPLTINQNFDTTDLPDVPTDKNLISVPSAELDNLDTQVSYEVHSLPKLELNSSQVHGILIDFMNSTKADDKLRRILTKLNTTENDFLAKMRQIEENPLTRRLILLLISECGQNSAGAVGDIISLANSGESLYPSGTTWDAAEVPPEGGGEERSEEIELTNDDQDSRALQLLNSLYSIASKYGK